MAVFICKLYAQSSPLGNGGPAVRGAGRLPPRQDTPLVGTAFPLRN
jgi:hypothetical protein